MSDRMQLLEEAYAIVSKYTTAVPGKWRPSITDLMVYDIIIGMHESDYEDINSMSYIWRKTPDEVMEALIDTPRIFDLEYGLEQLDEDVRDYLLEQEFIAYVDDVSDEEYKTNLEQRK